MNFTEEEKKFLLQTARKTLQIFFKQGEKYEPKTDNRKFLEKRGVFVTLHAKSGELRGCVGYIEPVEELLSAVAENALAAAIHDDRFPPVREEELDDLEIEISVLSAPQRVEAEKIKQGDGVVLKKGLNKSTYLPQVWEQIQDKEIFLSSLCQKASLSADCWQDEETELYRYGVEVFSEKKFK